MNPSLSAHRRQEDLDALADGGGVDLLVVGGGVTGAGVALDAASRGLSVALVERRDLAAGTSRWSSKLVHGGLRYLAQGQVGVALESARERHILMTRTAPHLTRAVPFVIPLGPDLRAGAAALTFTGLLLGDALRVVSATPGRLLPRARRIRAAEARSLFPALAPTATAALLHFDGQLEDDARLVVALARTAASYGARVVTHCAAEQVRADGAVVRDERSGATVAVRARAVVVATGVWAPELVPGVPLRPSKGAHLVVRSGALGNAEAGVSVLVPGSRNRWVFTVPRPDGLTLVGLTDDPLDGPPVEAPAVDGAERDFLLATLARGLRTALTPDDVVASFAGLRPLYGAGDGATADLSRRHALLDRDGVLVLVGGKLTTYRAMAEDAVDRVVQRLGRDVACRTRQLPLVGAAPAARLASLGAPERLVRRFGTEAFDVAALGTDPLVADVPVVRGEVHWALRQEGALTVDDVLDRRLRLDLVPQWRAAAHDAVAGILAETSDGVHQP